MNIAPAIADKKRRDPNHITVWKQFPQYGQGIFILRFDSVLGGDDPAIGNVKIEITMISPARLDPQGW
jgi:hypothetical protein